MNSYVKHFRDLEVYKKQRDVSEKDFQGLPQKCEEIGRMLVGVQISSFRNDTRHVPSGGARRSCPTSNECLRRLGQLRPRNADGETRTMITDY